MQIPQDDHSLFHRIQKGDWVAFSEVFKACAEDLYLYAAGFIGSQEDAKDIVQEIFVYLWVNRLKISSLKSFRAYLFRSVKNSCIDYKLHRRIEEKYQKEMSHSLAATGEDPEEFERLYTRVRRSIDALPAKCREIFILGCVEGLSYEEIAGQLGISINTVKTQIKVAYKKVKTELGEKNMPFVSLFFSKYLEVPAGLLSFSH